MSKSVVAKLFVVIAAALLFVSPARAQWSTLVGSFPGNPDTCVLLTDGTVMCHQYETQHWHRLVPDKFGSYQNGTWDPSGMTIADMPNGVDGSTSCAPPTGCTYAPLYFASQVLPSGQVVVIGGEDNTGNSGDTNIGFMYNPVTNTWSTQLNEAFGYGHIGDAESIVLQDGTMVLADISNGNIESFDPSTLTFTALNPPGKLDNNDEEGWTPLPGVAGATAPLDGQLLDVAAGIANTYQIYDPLANQWLTPSPDTTAGITLADDGGNCNSIELGPAVELPNGTVIQFSGGFQGVNAVYDIASGTWSQAANSFPAPSGEGQLTVSDGPASLLPNGDALVMAGPGCKQTGASCTKSGPGCFACTGGMCYSPYNAPSHIFEWDGTNLNEVTTSGIGFQNASSYASYQGRMLLLPTGEVLVLAYNQGSTSTLELYTATGGPQNAWRPVITAVPAVISPGNTYNISGNQFNGFSLGAFYGDDAQMSTNYPLVQITNHATGHVFYARTHDPNRMGVEAVGSTEVETTSFDTPADMETGLSDLVVITNGIPSEPFVVNGPALTLPGPLSLNTCSGSSATTTLNACNTGAETLDVNSITSSSSLVTVSTPSSGYPVSISPDACFPFQVSFQPSSPGTTNATLTIASNDPNHPNETVAVTGTAPAPSINLTVNNGGNFGNVCPGGAQSLNLNVTNQSSCNLVINSITTSADFFPPSVKLPLILTADATVPLPISFDPSTSQACSTSPITGTVTINSNDPTQPGGNTIVGLSGTVPCPHIATTIPNNGNFGTLCSGQVSDLNLEVLNTGQCNLNIASISSSSTQFSLPTAPLVLSADANVDLPVAFQPAKYGSPGYETCSNTVPETSNVTIVSNDPTTPILTVPVQGIEGCPTLVLGPLNLTGVNDYPPTVSDPTGTLGCYTDKQITVSNTGICPLYVVKAQTVNGLDGKGLPLPASPLEYNVVNTTLPITVKPAAKAVPVTVRFKPEILTDQNPFAPDQQTGTLNLTSNDPVAGDNTAALCGEPTYGSGARILLVDTLDNPISEVTELILTTTDITPPFNETLKPAPLQPPANVCGNTINYHLDNETLNPTGSNPNAYYRVLVKDNPHYYPPVDFRLTQCQFQQIVIVRKY